MPSATNTPGIWRRLAAKPVATPESSMDGPASREYKANVIVRNQQAEPAFDAMITIWASPRKN